MQQPPLTPDELTTVGEIITYILSFIGGWIFRIIQARNPNKNDSFRKRT